HLPGHWHGRQSSPAACNWPAHSSTAQRITDLAPALDSLAESMFLPMCKSDLKQFKKKVSIRSFPNRTPKNDTHSEAAHGETHDCHLRSFFSDADGLCDLCCSCCADLTDSFH